MNKVEEYEEYVSIISSKLLADKAIDDKSLSILEKILGYGINFTPKGLSRIFSDLTYSEEQLNVRTIKIAQSFMLLLNNENIPVQGEEDYRRDINDLGIVSPPRNSRVKKESLEPSKIDFDSILFECKDLAELSKTYSSLRVDIMKNTNVEEREEHLLTLNDCRNKHLSRVKAMNIIQRAESPLAVFNEMKPLEVSLNAAFIYDRLDPPQEDLIVIDLENQVAFI